MFDQFMNNIAEQSKSVVEPAFKFQQLAFGQFQEICQKQLDLANEYAKYSIESAEKLTKLDATQDFSAIAQKQAQSMNEFSAKVAADMSDLVNLTQSFGTQWKTLIEAEAKPVTTKGKKAA